MVHLRFLLVLIGVSLFASCEETKPQKEKVNPVNTTIQPKSSNNCTYGVRKSGVMLRWLAFKTTERIGVSGTFGDVRIKSNQVSPSLQALFESVSFEIDTKTILSNDDGRDKKIIHFFFEKLVNGNVISGSVKSVDVPNKKGIFTVEMNGMSHDMPFNFTQEKKELIVTAFMDVNKWSAQEALAAINMACEEKHKGKDGISKTWPDVNIDIRIPLALNCK